MEGDLVAEGLPAADVAADGALGAAAILDRAGHDGMDQVDPYTRGFTPPVIRWIGSWETDGRSREDPAPEVEQAEGIAGRG